ncbi:MAG: flagellar motor switch protein FliN [Planctomycetota bacterium]
MSDESNTVDDVVAEALAEAQSQVSDLQGEVDAVTGLGSPMQTGIDMLGDVDLQVTVELGRTEMLVEDVLRLGNGSVVELDKLAGDPVDVFVNGRLVARGEVLVLNDNFCIRISEIVTGVDEVLPEDAEAEVAPSSAVAEG